MMECLRDQPSPPKPTTKFNRGARVELRGKIGFTFFVYLYALFVFLFFQIIIIMRTHNRKIIKYAKSNKSPTIV